MNLWDVVKDNWSYNLIALLISLILWFTILGRRDFVFTRTMDLEFKTAPTSYVSSAGVERVKVKVSGPRLALKKFLDSSMGQNIYFDLTDKREGNYEILITHDMVDLPVGVKVVSIRPAKVPVTISPGDPTRMQRKLFPTESEGGVDSEGHSLLGPSHPIESESPSQ